jgi:ATP-dependent helicase HrpA
LEVFEQKIRQLEALLPGAMLRERLAATGSLRALRQRAARNRIGKKQEQQIARLEKRLLASVERRGWRRENRPACTYPDELPITARREDIVAAIRRHPVVIVSGETGSGKSTQIPKMCLEAGGGIEGLIGHTQPRRIAAVSVARRIAEELGAAGRRAVGYKIRFRDRTPRDAYVKVMTDGILLAETQGSRMLALYDTIIVDEAHERSLNIDFILGLLQGLRRRRRDLKIVVTSATIDTEKFSRAFSGAPVIEVSGRMFPVDIRYEAPEDWAAEGEELTHVEMAVRAVHRLQRQSLGGDMLVFMPTEQDIRETCEALESEATRGAIVMPLYARLTAAEQTRVFRTLAARKIIVATNVAETAITIPGIRYVVDTGLARIARYSPRTRTTSLPVSPISRSSADQRAGRCGRVQNGICIRLYSEEDYLARPRFTPPEIVRANLAEVILRMIDLRLGDVAQFPFIDRPDAKSVRDGFNLLFELGAVESGGGKNDFRTGGTRAGLNPEAPQLTPTGRLMAQIPLDPRLSRMLIEAHRENCLAEVAVIAAALSIQDIRERPVEKAAEADRLHALFDDPSSDFVTLLNIWRHCHGIIDARGSNNQLRRFCREHFLSFRRLREWRDIHRQIVDILGEHGLTCEEMPRPGAAAENLRLDPAAPFYATLHRAVLSGLLSNIGQRREHNLYRATKGREAMIFPGSGLFNHGPEWIVAAEMVETSRLYARTAAAIDSSWLETLGGQLCRRTHLNPRWDRNRGEVVAKEQVSLYGLIIVSGRPVPYGRIAPADAAGIFYRRALVDGDVRKPFGFLRHNLQLIERIRSIEDRLRRRDLLVGEDEQVRFYRQRLGDVSDTRTLARIIRKRGGDEFLRMSLEDLMNYRPQPAELQRYPERIRLGRGRFTVDYRFEPGAPSDGVTVNIPVGRLTEADPQAVDWLVPGLFREKVEALIKGLPKGHRKRLVPVNRTVEIIANEMPRGSGTFLGTLAEFIHRRFGVNIPSAAWPAAIADHLNMRIAVTAPDGRELRAGRDARILQEPVTAELPAKGLDRLKAAWEREGIRDWDFGDLPRAIRLPGDDDAADKVFPALEPAPDATVRLRLFADAVTARRAHRQGIAALYAGRFAKDLKQLKRRLGLSPAEVEASADFGGEKALAEAVVHRAVQRLFARDIRTRSAFEAHGADAWQRISTEVRGMLQHVRPLLAAYGETRKELSELRSGRRGPAGFIAARSGEMARLVPPNFIELYDEEQISRLERYVRAIGIRARRGLVDPEKDRLKAESVSVYAEALQELLDSLTDSTSAEKRAAVEAFFWLLEEYKVSVFAQELKTSVPVSPKRLEEKLDAIRRMV